MIQAIKANRFLIFLWAASLAAISLSPLTTGYLSLLALGFFLIATLRCEPETLLTFLFSLLPFANLFKLSADSMSLFTVCEVLVVLRFVFKRRVRVSLFLSTGLLLVYMLIQSLTAMSPLTLIKIVLGFLLIGFSTVSYTQDGLKKTAHLLSLSTIIMMLLSCNQRYLTFIEPYFIDLDYYVDSTGHATETLRISGFFGDPNYCAVLIVMVLALLCVLYYHKAIGPEFWIHAGFLVPLGFFTYSKSYFLCLIMLLILLIVFVLFPKHKVWAVLALGGLFVGYFFAVNGKIEMVNMIMARFEQGDFTTGRSQLNQTYLDYIFHNTKVLLFGEGIHAERMLYAKNNVHNLFIELLFKMGFVGGLLYLGTLKTALSQNRFAALKARRHFADYLPLMFFLVLFSFLSGVLNYAFPFYVLIVYLSLNFVRLEPDGATARGDVP